MSNTIIFKSGFITIIGRPNVGKSTLLNQLIGEKLAITSNKPQTTRNQILGIKNLENAQLIFLDTPGIHKTNNKFNKFMVMKAVSTYQNVDIILFMVEAQRPCHIDDLLIIDTFKSVNLPRILLINKIDLIKKETILTTIDSYYKINNFSEFMPISAKDGTGIELLKSTLVKYLPEGPQYFQKDMITDLPEKFFVAEMIREEIIKLTHKEMPYSTAVKIEEFKIRENRTSLIRAIIWVEKKSQKMIIIGKNGHLIKKIGINSRKKIERWLKKPIYLDLWVKVKDSWKKKEKNFDQIF
ncbi:MAG: GTPase Era [Thermodesulfobacteriota bacterium]|nr:GTPase Era [Thermodesulfobacteriota bacterium]